MMQPSARKRARIDCIIHCSDDDSDALVSPQDLDSWNTLLRAAEIRQHDPVLEAAKGLEEGGIPHIHYHRKCRSLFTMKKSLDSILAKGVKIESASVDPRRRASRDAPSTSRIYAKVCLFCEKSSKYMKAAKTREPLIQCVELRADEKIRRAATRKLNQRILGLLSRDLVAAEGHYHKSCYKLFTKDDSPAAARSGAGENQEESEGARYEEAEIEALEELFLYIRTELFPNPEVLPMINLTSRLERSMMSRGIIQLKPATKKHVRRKIETEFGESLRFVPDEKGKLLIYPRSLSMDDLARQAHKMTKDLQEARAANSEDILTKAGMQLRNEINKQDVSQPWPPDTDQNVIPAAVTKFLHTLLTGECECQTPSERAQRLATSFGSDLVFAVTSGKTKPPKHLAGTALSHVVHEGAKSRRIDVVFDVYKETSIKDAERANRSAGTGIHFKNIQPGHNIQQWRKLLGSSSNKASLIKFLVEEWKKPQHREKLEGKELYVTCEQLCFKITKEQWEEAPELKSSQEEADTRLLLHALHAAESGYKSVIITAEDTDVMVLCLGMCHKIPSHLFQKCGTKNRTRFLDITTLSRTLGGSVCDSLIRMHAFTGCDTVSAFAGRGKMTALKQVKMDKTYQDAFHELGRSWEVSPELFEKLQEITCHMYLPSTHTTEVNKLRYELFCARRGEVESSQLPPCEDCLFMHALRANYQAAIWRRSLQSQPFVANPTDCGWMTDEDGKLAVNWMRGSPAPDAVMQLLSCKCVRSCELPKCTCLSNGLKCTDMCRLQTCQNKAIEEEPVAQQSDSESDVDDIEED
ncbi:hypothetical protein GWK47_009996 [Chionoecetes opilio]|uniref:Tesmin/TSO1-like CXC domain-containing protein n=1 Tax=Chionoecetes opilio TaxID=41210 RepID=A0A8J4Y2Q5_CHIOP|nr:hypothetical protein GWK47_009996 [Chionoecetes opilio]